MLQGLSRLVRGPVRWHAAIGGLFALALAGEMFGLHALDTAESRLADVYMRHHAADFKADPDVILVDIDDAAMRDMEDVAGLWAWPREIHADLLDALAEFKPRAVVFDIAFSEHDIKRPKSEARLSEALADAPHAYLGSTLLNDSEGQAQLLAPLQQAFGIAKPGAADARAVMLLPNAVKPAVWRLGLDNSEIDGDGVLRHHRLFADVAGWRLPSLPARVAMDLGVALPPENVFLMSWPRSGRVRYTYGKFYRLLLEQRPGANAAEVQKIADQVHGKVIVIGSSATSNSDYHLTPLGASYPGIELLATEIDNLLNHTTVRPASPWWPFGFGLLLIAALSLAFALRFNPLAIGAALFLSTPLALYAADMALARLLLLPLVAPLVFAWLWYLAVAVAGYLRERRSRDKAVALFGRFLNPAVVGKLVDQGETIDSMSGRSSEVTVLFSDIRGFTTLSETTSPQKVVALLNRYFERQVEVVFRHGGTLDKFIGDCIMAFWGAPIADPAHAQRAVAAAIEMQEVLLQFRKELAEEGNELADLDVGIGVHTGSAVVGFIGAQRKLDYTAIGDTVNLASRIEGLTKGVARVLVSRETMEACQAAGGFTFELRGAFDVKGRVAKVELYEPKKT
jgi:adenylate cyclase